MFLKDNFGNNRSKLLVCSCILIRWLKPFAVTWFSTALHSPVLLSAEAELIEQCWLFLAERRPQVGCAWPYSLFARKQLIVRFQYSTFSESIWLYPQYQKATYCARVLAFFQRESSTDHPLSHSTGKIYVIGLTCFKHQDGNFQLMQLFTLFSILK